MVNTGHVLDATTFLAAADGGADPNLVFVLEHGPHLVGGSLAIAVALLLIRRMQPYDFTPIVQALASILSAIAVIIRLPNDYVRAGMQERRDSRTLLRLTRALMRADKKLELTKARKEAESIYYSRRREEFMLPILEQPPPDSDDDSQPPLKTVS
ncbi:hypothetical protein [Amycolatopsis samaneae]|uniref:Uncharacterized protein n=1 Tax=Amycolatopsis samaneae TaxID=664691 RepID=A0ABW5GI72_9PSEU